MDINQPSITSFNSSNIRKPSTSSAANSDIASINDRDTRMSSTSRDTTSLNWKEGQVLKGEIIDRKFNEVTLVIEPGKQVVTAKLSGDVGLSIGQTASFKVTEDANGQYTLRYMPSETDTSSNPTVQKALIASNLSLTDRNKSIVAELLNHNMPIDKQTLQTLVKLSYTNKDASPLTLVLMMKNNIPMTTANIRQFESIQNGTSKMLDDIHTITNSLMQQLSEAGIDNTENAVVLNTKLLDILYQNSDSNLTQTVNTPDTPINKFLSESDLTLLSNSLMKKMSDGSNFPITIQSELANQLLEGTISISDAIKLITELSRLGNDVTNDSENILHADIKGIVQDEVINQTANNLSADKDLVPTAPTLTENFSTAAPVVTSLFEKFSAIQRSPNEITQLLSSTEQKNLMDQLSSLPDAQEITSKITAGTATIKEVLSFVQNSLSKAEASDMKALLQSPVYQTLMNEAFHQKWTVSPEKLANKEAMTKFYDDLQNDMETLNNVLSSGKNLTEHMQSHASMKNLHENLSFLKDLNEVFTFQQLPLQFKDQDVHGDLYVYTNKNALKNNNGVLSILLHLTMNHLGPLNIHIKMDHNIIQANFDLEDSEACEIIRNNLTTLSAALKKKGYSLHADVRTDYKNPDFCNDFIEQDFKENSTKKYTFDIRT